MPEINVIVIGTEGTALNITEQIADSVSKGACNAALKGVISDVHTPGSFVNGYRVLGGTSDISLLMSDMSVRFVYALWKPEKMKERYELLKKLSIPEDRLFTFIHPLAWVSPSAVIGEGSVVLSGSAVHSKARLGSCCVINSSVVIEHEAILGDAFFAAAGTVVGAKVKAGNFCFAGLNSSIRENTVLGDNVFIGMHSLVTTGFSDCRVKGVPAREIPGTPDQ
jgi:acetyltransferase EpsM